MKRENRLIYWRIRSPLRLMLLSVCVLVLLGFTVGNAQVTQMYWTEAGRIQKANLDGTDVKLVTGGLINPQGIAVDRVRRQIFWVDAGTGVTGVIHRAGLDGEHDKVIIQGLAAPVDIAVDVLGGKVYWTDQGTRTIQRANLDGTNIYELPIQGLEIPFGIAVDVNEGKVYWTDAGINRIRRSDLDGANVETLPIQGLAGPRDIAVDPVGRMIYWTQNGTIQRSDPGGANVKVFSIQGLVQPQGLTLDVEGGKVYWVDRGTGKIQRMNLDGSGVVEDLVAGLVDPRFIDLGPGGNENPDVAPLGNQEVVEGRPTLNLKVIFTDPDAIDTHRATIDWGDNTVDTVDPATSPIVASHTYLGDDANYTVTVTVTDDNGASDSESFTVRAINEAPQLISLTNQTPPESAPTVTLRADFTDPGLRDTHTAIINWGDDTIDTIAPATSPIVASHTYLVNTDPYTVTITVTDDDQGSDTAPFIVTFNDPPIFAPVADQQVLENSGQSRLAITGISAGPKNEGNQVVTLTAESSNPSIVPNPIITPSSAIATPNRVLSFTPAANAFGTVTITVKAKDNGGREKGGKDDFSREFTIEVIPVNDPPRFDLIPNQRVLEDSESTQVTITGISPGPENEANQTVTLTATSSNESIVPHPTITGTGTTRTLIFAPEADAFDTVTITVTAQDNGGTENNGQDTSPPQPFRITVIPVNDPPRFDEIENPPAVLEGAQITPVVSITGVSPGPQNESSQTVTLTAVSSDPSIVSNFTITPSRATGSTDRIFSFTLVPNAFRVVTITVTAQDDGGTENNGQDTSEPQSFQITVIPVNDPPTFDFIEEPPVVFEDAETTPVVSITKVSPGPENEANQTVTLTAVSSNPSIVSDFEITPESAIGTTDRILNFTVAPNASGTVTVTVTATDTGGTANGGRDDFSRTFTIKVKPVNDRPVAGADGPFVVLEGGTRTVNVPGVLGNDSDIEGGPLVAVLDTPPINGTLDLGADGSFIYRHNGSETTADSFTYHAEDGFNESNPVTVDIAVRPVNDPPIFDFIAGQPVIEKSGTKNVSITGVHAAAENELNQMVALRAESSNPEVVPNSIVIEGDGTTRVLRFAPGKVGEAKIKVVAQDDGGTANSGEDEFNRTFTVTVGLGVWPGDTDNHRNVNILDILPLGAYWHESGEPWNSDPELSQILTTPARFPDAPEWQAYFAVPWAIKEATYADTNGDGQVNEWDIIPIAMYWNEPNAAPQMNQVELGFNRPDRLHIYEKMYEVLKQIPVQSPGVLALQHSLELMIFKKMPEQIPAANALFQSYPNPANPETWIPYQLAKTGEVEIQIYMVNGRLIRRLALGDKHAGYYMDKTQAAYWDGTNEFGERVGSGIYFYSLRAGRFFDVGRLLLLK